MTGCFLVVALRFENMCRAVGKKNWDEVTEGEVKVEVREKVSSC